MLDAVLDKSAAARGLQLAAARMLHAIGVSANLATAAGVASGVASGIAFALGDVGTGLALLAISAVFDAIDGTIAREFATPTMFGGVADLVCDRIVETAVIIGIVWRHPDLDFFALLLVASWYVNITVFLAVGAALERRGPKIIDYPPGILERTEALIFFAILALVESLGRFWWMGGTLCVAMTALEIATGVQRFAFGWRTIKGGTES